MWFKFVSNKEFLILVIVSVCVIINVCVPTK